MAKYRVLPSTAHNYGASFISVMNMATDDYAMCYLVRAAAADGVRRIEVDLLTGDVSPDRLPSKFLKSIAGYVAGFGAHVQRSGASLDMLSRAAMRLDVALGRVIGQPDPVGVHRARIGCEVELVDNRGKTHVGRTEQDWVCHTTRRFY
jgi:hypothetical protein